MKSLLLGVLIGATLGVTAGKQWQYRQDVVAVKKLVNELVSTLNDIHAREIQTLKAGTVR